MGLIEQIKMDIARITTTGSEFAISILFTDLNGFDFNVFGTHKKHHLAFDETGVPVNVKTASVSVSEAVLVNSGCTVRNGSNEVKMNGFKVKCKDSTGVLRNYIVRECYPDETIGLIVFLLSDFE